MIMFLIMGSLAKGKARLFAEATPGTGAITAVEKSMRAHGEEHDAGFWLTMTVEVPGRAPFTARVHGSFSPDVAKRLQPGLVIPVRVHPSNPQKPLIGTDSLLRPLR